MEQMSSVVLTDPAYAVPGGGQGASGLAGVRALVVRFCDGAARVRRRALTEAVLAGVRDAAYVDGPTRSMLAALGLPLALETDVALIASAYQPHAPQSAEADAAADRLIDACGGRHEAAAARLCVLVQGHAALLAQIEALRSGSGAAPVPSTRRLGPDGVEVEVGLADAPFGRGPHRCPAEPLARRWAAEALA
jgi:hypothetical protein